jgi:hypothetical protein
MELAGVLALLALLLVGAAVLAMSKIVETPIMVMEDEEVT